MGEKRTVVAGIDVGTECTKAVVLDEADTLLGRSVVPMRGYFEDRVREALANALDEAKLTEEDLVGTCATGFGMNCVPAATLTVGEALSHATGAYHHVPHAMTVLDIGGRHPKMIRLDEAGHLVEVRALRRCAAGIGTFLMFAARHLDVHPTQLEELAASVDAPADVGSYCSVLAGSELLERLREGATREEVALGCIRSIGARIAEMGRFEEPVKVTGGVAEYFPGVLQALAEVTGLEVDAVPAPIITGAFGAAQLVRRAVHNVEAAVNE